MGPHRVPVRVELDELALYRDASARGEVPVLVNGFRELDQPLRRGFVARIGCLFPEGRPDQLVRCQRRDQPAEPCYGAAEAVDGFLNY